MPRFAKTAVLFDMSNFAEVVAIRYPKTLYCLYSYALIAVIVCRRKKTGRLSNNRACGKF
jgi:hypothetical protein